MKYLKLFENMFGSAEPEKINQSPENKEKS